jgi:hypothetical protein
MTRDSAWWRDKLDTSDLYGSMWGDVIDCLAAEEKAHAITREALAASEAAGQKAEQERDQWRANAELGACEETCAIVKALSDAVKIQNVTLRRLSEESEAALADLRATFGRTVAAWKREELGWDEEREELTKERDDLRAYYTYQQSGWKVTGPAYDDLIARIEAARRKA